MSLLLRLRLLFGRRPWLHPLLVGIAALVVWWQAAALHQAAATAKDAWGTTRTVWVVNTDTERGASVHAAARRYPTAMVPAGAISEAPSEAVAAHDLAEGTVLTPLDLASPHDVPVGWVVFAVPAEAGPELRPGDAVAVFNGGRRMCDGRVVGTTAPLEVAVAPACATGVSTAVAVGEVVLARLGT
jgi:hypothetical protein